MDFFRNKILNSVIYNNQKKIKDGLRDLIQNKYQNNEFSNGVNVNLNFVVSNQLNKLVEELKLSIQKSLEKLSSFPSHDLPLNIAPDLTLSQIEHNYNALANYIQKTIKYSSLPTNLKSQVVAKVDECKDILINVADVAKYEKNPSYPVLKEILDNLNSKLYYPIKFDSKNRKTLDDVFLRDKLRKIGTLYTFEQINQHFEQIKIYLDQMIRIEDQRIATLGAEKYDDIFVQRAKHLLVRIEPDHNKFLEEIKRLRAQKKRNHYTKEDSVTSDTAYTQLMIK